MENNNTIYRINAPSIVFEEIDGEAVIVNMENGSYYSLDDAGAFIWSRIEGGSSANDVVKAVRARYDGEDELITRSVRALIGKFVEEELVVSDAAGSGEPLDGKSVDAPAEKETFVPPELRKYCDMEELLLLDPVHDLGIDESATAESGNGTSPTA